MKNIILYIFITFLFPLHLIAQEEGKKYAQVQQEVLKKVDDADNVFRVFQGEILDRNDSLMSILPNKKKLFLGKGDDMKSFEKPKIISNDLLKKIIRKQKVFLEDGTLKVGYLFDFSDLAPEIEEDTEVKAVNYLNKTLFLKKNGTEAKKNYPYDPSGLVYFYPSIIDFSDPYIRIIVPGYATAFVDKDSIEEIKSTYDSTVFDEYTLVINEKPQYVLYNDSIRKVYKLNRDTFEYAKILEDGKYKIQGINKQFIIINGNATIEDIPLPPASSLNIWMIIAIIELPILLFLLYLFRKRILNMLSRKRKEPTDASESTETNGNWGGMNDATQEDNTYETISNDTSSKSLKKLKGEILKSIKEHQEKTVSKIEMLQEGLQSSNKAEIDVLKTKNTSLISEKEQLVQDNEKLNADVVAYTATIDRNNKRELVLDTKVKRFEEQALFVENYNIQTKKLISFFDVIKQIENQLIAEINSQTNYTIKQFQSIVFTKYLNHKITTAFKDWDSILRIIESNDGLIVDKTLIHQIKNKTSSHDQLEGIEWIIVNDILLSKINRLLILLEELRNTGKITATNTEFSSIKVEVYKSNIISEMKSLFGVEIEDITLFSNFQSYVNIKSVPERMSYDLSQVTLRMGDIKEIKTYGMKLKERIIETIVIEK